MVNSTRPSMIMSLSKFTTAKAIWSHLKEHFVQDSGSLLHTLMQQTHIIEQHDMSIDEYYSAFDRLMGEPLWCLLVQLFHVPLISLLRSSSPTNLLWEFDLNLIHFMPDCFILLTLSPWLRRCLNYLLKRLVLSQCLLLLVRVLTVCWLLFRNPGVPLFNLVSIVNRLLTAPKNALLSLVLLHDMIIFEFLDAHVMSY
jgi:hypothetical protein